MTITSILSHMCEYKLEFKNQRRKPTLLAAPLLASHRGNIAINRALLFVEKSVEMFGGDG